jgi:hypothetical protein
MTLAFVFPEAVPQTRICAVMGPAIAVGTLRSRSLTWTEILSGKSFIYDSLEAGDLCQSEHD